MTRKENGEKYESTRRGITRFLAMLLALISLVSVALPATGFAEGEEPEEDLPLEGGVYSDFPTDFSLTDWMKYIPGYWKISQLNLPGTHDSGTYKMKLTPKWSQAQQWNFQQQLDNGIRFFDIRVREYKGVLILNHGKADCYYDDHTELQLKKHVLPVIEEWIRNHSTETIVFKVVHETSNDTDKWKTLNILLNDIVPNLDKNLYIVPNNDIRSAAKERTPVMTLSEARGHIIFLMNDNITKYEDHCDERTARSKEKYVKHALDTSYKMSLGAKDVFCEQGWLENMEENKKEGNPDVKWLALNNNAIAKGITWGIKQYAKDINGWFEKQTLTQGIRYGWMPLDWPTVNEIKMIIRTNPTIKGKTYNWYVTDDRTLHIASGQYINKPNVIDCGEFDDAAHFVKPEDAFWYKHREMIASVVVEDAIEPVSLSYWFNGLSRCRKFDLGNLSTYNAKDMRNMFSNCTLVQTLDITSFSRGMLDGADAVDVTEMFANDPNLQTIYADEKSFHLDYSNVKKSSKMFYGDGKLVGGLGTKCDGSENLTRYARVDTPEHQGFFTDPADMAQIYWGISSDGTLYISHHEDAQTPTPLTITGQAPPWTNNERIRSVVVTERVKVDSLKNWFYGLSNCESFDLAKLDLSGCVDMSGMFEMCRSVGVLDLSGWAESLPCTSMFRGCSNLGTIYVEDGFSMANQQDSHEIFKGCNNLRGGNGTPYDPAYDDADYQRAIVDGSGIGPAPGYFTVKKALYWGYDTYNKTLFLGGTPSAETPFVFDDYRIMVSHITPWASYVNDIQKVSVISSLSPDFMSYWFKALKNCKEFDLALMDTSKAATMTSLFEDCSSVEELNLWNFTGEKLSEFARMFYGMTKLKTIYAAREFDMVLSPFADGSDVFTKDDKLVGGCGTTLKDMPKGNGGKVFFKVDDYDSPGLFTESTAYNYYYWGVNDSGQLTIGDESTAETPNPFPDIKRTSVEQIPWNRENITSVFIGKPISPIYTSHWFDNTLEYYHIESFHLENLDTSLTLDMSYMFAYNRDCPVLDIENFGLSPYGNVTTTGMFCWSGFEAIIVNEEFDLTAYPAELCQEMFQQCINLYGGQGTHWVSVSDNTYARYDGKGGKPGYFTLLKDLKYPVYFKNDDGQVLQCVRVQYRELPEYTGPTPTKESSPVFHYSFKGWKPEITSVFGAQFYVAEYLEIPREYTAIYYAAETGEDVLDTVIFYYEEEPSTDKIPVKQPTQEIQYEFTGWSLDRLEGDTFYYRPVFEEQAREYAVSFYDDDGTGTTLLWMDFYHFGDMPTYQGPTPTKKSDALYTYSFYGWSPLIHTVTDTPVAGMEDPNRYNVVYLQTPIQYHVVSGDGGVYYKNNDGTQAELQFEIDTNWRNLSVEYPGENTGWIQLDGVYISTRPGNYVKLEDKVSESDGQTHMVLTLYKSLMNIMNAGPHTVTLLFKNGTTVTANFNIVDDPVIKSLPVNIYKLIKQADTATETALGGARLTLTGLLLSGTESGEIDYAVSWITPEDDSEQKYEQLFLAPGQYWLTENDVPFGYKKAEEIKFYITEDLELVLGEMPETEPPAMLSIGTDELTLSKTAEEEPEEVFEEEMPAIEETEVTEENPVVEEAKVTEESPVVEETEVTEESPVVEETEFKEEAQDKQESAGEHETLTTEEPTGTLMMSPLGDSPDSAPAPAELRMYDEVLPTLKVYFYKRDEAGALLDGAKLHLTSMDGKLGEQWESSEDFCLTLPVGRYTLFEDEAPAGFEIAPCVQFEIGVAESGYVYIHIIDPDGTVLAPETALGTELMASTNLSSVCMADDNASGYVAMYDVAKRATVPIQKTDADGQLLGNAGLLVKDAKNQTVASWTSKASAGHKIRLLPGSYQLIEDNAPEGYLKATPISFTVTDEYEVKIDESIVSSISMKDEEIPKVTIAKVTADEEDLKSDKSSEEGFSGIHLGGAELKVTGSDINVFYSWITLPGTDKELKLLPGDYVLSEITPPAGYLPAEDIAFTVTDDYQIIIDDETLPDATILMVDEELPKIDVIFAKTDNAEPAKSLSDAILQVTGETINYFNSWETETDQTKTLSLLPGDYTLRELRAPGGYLLAEDIRFRVKVNQTVWLLGTDEAGEETETPVTDKTLTMVDKQAPKMTVKVVKTDGTASLGGAQLRVDGADVNFMDAWETVAGEDHTLDLSAGTYVLSEDGSPDGYYKADDIKFRVKEVGEEKTLKLVLVGSDDSETAVDNVEMTDVLIPIANVTLKFLDEAGTSVGGAKLHVEGTDNPFYAKWTSEDGADKDIVLRVGSYRMVEDEAPDGYLPSESRKFRVTTEGKLILILDDGEVEAEYVTMTASLSPTYPVTMALVNEKGELLGGAMLHVEDSKMTVIASWSSTSVPTKELAVQPGSYRMIEDAAPEGYDKATAIEFYVTHDGRILIGDDDVEVKKIEMINLPTPPMQYFIIEGANSTWTHGSGQRHRFASNAPFAKFVSVEVDGKTVPSGYYTVFEGSTIVNFSAEYMQSLALGKHSLRIVSLDGSASTEFTVIQGRFNPPKTGDESNVSVWLLLMVLSAVGFCVCTQAVGKKKKNWPRE